MQPIKIKLRQNQVEGAVMCQIKTEHNVSLVRLAAMHKRNPLYILMFGKNGNLLNTNDAAMIKFGVKSIGGLTLDANPCLLPEDNLHLRAMHDSTHWQ